MSKPFDSDFFDHKDLQSFFKQFVESKPRGESARIAKALNIHTTLVSQVLNGHKNFTEEQVSLLCEYLSLKPIEADYLISLCQLSRAGNPSLKNIIELRLQGIRERAQEISHRVLHDEELSLLDQAVYYSSYQYTLIRLLTSIDHFRTVDLISKKAGLPKEKVQLILDFLVSRNLCENKSGSYTRTNKNTHISRDSPLVNQHHQNWRARALSLLEEKNRRNLVFTSPLSISKNDAEEVRKVILDAISEISKIVSDSPPEEIYYLGIDWLQI